MKLALAIALAAVSASTSVTLSARADSVSPIAQAAPMRRQEVADLRSDIDRDFYHLSVVTNEQGDAVALNIYERDTDAGRTYDLAALRGRAVFNRTRGMDVISLSAPTLDARNGGTLSIVYLRNGITKSYVSFMMELVRLGDRWVVYTARNRGFSPISHLFSRGNRSSFFGLIGISRIEAN